MSETSSPSKSKGIPPIVLIGAGVGVVALLMSRGGSGGNTSGMQLDAYGQQLNEIKDQANRSQQAQEERDAQQTQQFATALEQVSRDAQVAQDRTAQDAARQNQVWQQMFAALNASIDRQIDAQNQAFERGLQQVAQGQQQQQAAYNTAWQQWQAQLAQLLQQFNQQSQQQTGNPAPAQPPLSFVGGPNVDNAGGRNGVITHEQATIWWRQFGGGVSPWNPEAGPLSGPREDRIHSSDVWKFIRQNGRLPASPQEFLAWYHQ